MKREELKKLGLEDTVIDAIMDANGKDIEKHKAAAESAKAEAESLKVQLTDAGATIEGFKKLDPEAIKKEADDWKAKAEQAQKEAEAKIASIQFDHALDGALAAAKAKNAKAVKALLDTNGLKQNGEEIVGLKEQLEKIKAENDYLFEDAKPAPKIIDKTNSQSVLGDPVLETARKYAGLPVKE